MTSVSVPSETRRHITFVQTDKAVHEEWAKFSIKRPIASGVLHYLAANVGSHNAVVVSQKLMAKALGVSDRSVVRAVADLEAGNWVQVVKLGAGRERAYVLNDRVAWTQTRDKLRLSRFSAEVIADAEDQSEVTMKPNALHRLPAMFEGEKQLPSGDGLPPVSQPFLRGLEPDLPATDGGAGHETPEQFE